jgi:uncharacterized protein YbjT (DUF2867 family)
VAASAADSPTVVLAGASGLIGRALLDLLLARGRNDRIAVWRAGRSLPHAATRA